MVVGKVLLVMVFVGSGRGVVSGGSVINGGIIAFGGIVSDAFDRR